MKNSTKIVSICLVMALMLCCCKTKVPKNQQNSTVATVEQVLKAQPEFSSMHIQKMNVNAVYGTQQLSFRATAKLLTDSVLEISLQPIFGVEMFRLIFTPTSFTVVDKWNRKYSENSYDLLRYKLGIDFRFEWLQACVSNRLFLIDKPVESTDFSVEMVDGAPVQLLHVTPDAIQRFVLGEALALTQSEVMLQQGKLSCAYAGHRMQNGVRFPTNFSLKITAQGYMVELNCEVQKMEFNKPIELGALNLSRYEKVTLSKILP